MELPVMYKFKEGGIATLKHVPRGMKALYRPGDLLTLYVWDGRRKKFLCAMFNEALNGWVNHRDTWISPRNLERADQPPPGARTWPLRTLALFWKRYRK